MKNSLSAMNRTGKHLFTVIISITIKLTKSDVTGLDELVFGVAALVLSVALGVATAYSIRLYLEI